MKRMSEKRCLYIFNKVLGGKGRRHTREQLYDAKYFDKRLWKLTCNLIERGKFNRRVADKLLLRKHPTCSQEILKRNKLQILLNLSNNKDDIRSHLGFKFEDVEYLQQKNAVQEVMRIFRSNEPEIFDLTVRALDNLIENEVATIHREWKRFMDQQDEGFARMSYFESIPQDEWESEEIRLAEMDRKEACRIKRVP
jgi:hypothetical protein